MKYAYSSPEVPLKFFLGQNSLHSSIAGELLVLHKEEIAAVTFALAAVLKRRTRQIKGVQLIELTVAEYRRRSEDDSEVL